LPAAERGEVLRRRLSGLKAEHRPPAPILIGPAIGGAHTRGVAEDVMHDQLLRLAQGADIGLEWDEVQSLASASMNAANRSLTISVVEAVIVPNSTLRSSIFQKRWLGMPAKSMAVGTKESASPARAKARACRAIQDRQRVPESPNLVLGDRIDAGAVPRYSIIQRRTRRCSSSARDVRLTPAG